MNEVLARNNMNNKKLFLICALSLVLALFVSGHSAHAATMSLIPDTSHVSVGQSFSVDIKIDTTDASTSINSAQATIQFPVGVVSAVSVDKQNSTFGFWLEDPVISNNDGTIHFIGGAIKGVAGGALQILRMTFKATGSGPADFSIGSAAVTAADGKGTNVLSGTRGTSVGVGTSALPPPVVPQGTTNAEQPVPVIRPAVPATGFPATPILRVPLYPDPSRWYNRVGDTIVLWDLPADITQVATRVSHLKDNALGTPEKTLSNGKDLGILQEGIWYVKVQFKNNIGWSQPAYYKISVDTTVPLPFDTQIQNAGTDNPSPTIQFETSDSLSGIAGYTVAVDGKESGTTTSTKMVLPPQSPGKHSLVVRALDLAGNSVQDTIGFEILPLPTPQIEFITKSISQGDFVFASGQSVAGGSVDVTVVDGGNREIFTGTAPADAAGHWDITMKTPLAVGQYFLSAISRDDRGAASLASAPQAFTVRPKSIISLGFIELGWLEILIIVILLVIAGGSLASRQYILGRQKRGLYNIIAGRDIEKLSDLLLANTKEISELPIAKDSSENPQFAYLIGKMNENVAKIKKYLKQELEKLK